MHWSWGWTITITTTDTDYSVPLVLSLLMHSSASATYTDIAAGGTSKFQSWFNPSNTPGQGRPRLASRVARLDRDDYQQPVGNGRCHSRGGQRVPMD